MRHVTFLALIFLTLVCAVIWKEASRPDAAGLSAELPLEAVSARPFAAGDVAKIEITGPSGEGAFTLAKSGDAWVAEQPFRAPAAAGNVTTLIESVLAAKGELRSNDAAKLAKFDLSDDRAATLKLVDAGGGVLTHLALGRSSGQQGAFVRLLHGSGDAAYAVTSDIRGALGLARTAVGATEPATPEATHFHDLAIATVAVSETAELRLESPLWTLRLAKQDGVWEVADGGPSGVPLKARGANDIVMQLGGQLQAQNLVDPARIAELGLDPAAYRVTAVLPDGTERRALGALDAEEQKYYVRLDVEQDPPVVYECTSWQWRKLFPQGSGLFEFPALGFEEADVGRVIADRRVGGLDDFEIRREGGAGSDWTVVSPRWGLSADRTAVNNIVGLLRSARAVDWSREPPASWTPDITLRVGRTGASDDELTTLLLGPAAPGGKDRLAVFPNTPGLSVVIAEGTFDRLAPEPITLFDPVVLPDFVEDDMVSVRVTRAEGDLRIDKGENDAWTVTADGETTPADPIRVRFWLGVLDDLGVGERTDYADAPQMTVEVDGEIVGTGSFGLSSQDARMIVHVGEAAFFVDEPMESLVPDVAKLRLAVEEDDETNAPEEPDEPGDGSDGEEE